jgi:hypothetical protein
MIRLISILFLFISCAASEEEILQNRTQCIYGVKYWISGGYGILTLLVDTEGRPIKCKVEE